MKFEKLECFIPLTLLAALVISHRVAAQDTAVETQHASRNAGEVTTGCLFG